MFNIKKVVMDQEKKTEKFQYKAEMKQLLNLIIHSLYTHPEVFLRELVSNSSDALNKIRFMKLTNEQVLSPEEELKITISVEPESGLFSIEDTGIGMTHEDLVERIGTVASSGTLEYIKNLKESDKLDAQLIGKFGVGFYSIFMVTDEVTIETRHADVNSIAYKWTSQGEDSYSVETIEKEARGTKISFKLKDDYKYIADKFQVKQILNKYSNFVDFPVYIDNEKINVVEALWHKKEADLNKEEVSEFYKFISNDFLPPLDYLKLDIEGTINFKALLFIPENAPQNLFAERDRKTLHLYSSKIFIQDDCQELLPDYLGFIKGVIDTEDLALNVSREVTQNSPIIHKIADIIKSRILSWLEKLADENKEKYEKFYSEFGSLFKTGANSDYMNKKRIIELLRYESSKTKAGEFTTLNKYTSVLDTKQEHIYYLTGPNREQLERNPNLEYFKKNEIEVLYLTDPVDVFTVPYFGEYEGKSFKSIEKADIKIEHNEESEITEEAKNDLLSYFKTVLGDKVEDVMESKRLVDSPVTLVIGAEGMDPQMEKMMQYMEKNYTLSKRILEVNINHQLIKNLAEIYNKDKEDQRLRNAIEQLYDSALLLEGYLKNPADFVTRMNDFIMKATEN